MPGEWQMHPEVVSQTHLWQSTDGPLTCCKIDSLATVIVPDGVKRSGYTGS